MKKDLINTITLKPISGKKEHVIQIAEITKLKLGTEIKYKIKSVFLGRKMEFITREITDSYIDTWKMLKKAGLPIIPLFRITSEMPGIKKQSKFTKFAVIPNITSSGSKLYGKSLAWEASKGTFKPNKKTDLMFKKILENDKNKLTSEISRIIKIANDNDIVLPEDGEPFELLVHDDGSWELIMVDIELARKRMKDLETKNDVIRTNESLTKDFFKYLKIIYLIL